MNERPTEMLYDPDDAPGVEAPEWGEVVALILLLPIALLAVVGIGAWETARRLWR